MIGPVSIFWQIIFLSNIIIYLTTFSGFTTQVIVLSRLIYFIWFLEPGFPASHSCVLYRVFIADVTNAEHADHDALDKYLDIMKMRRIKRVPACTRASYTCIPHGQPHYKVPCCPGSQCM